MQLRTSSGPRSGLWMSALKSLSWGFVGLFLITHDLDAGLGQTHAGTEITVDPALPVMPKGAYPVEVNAVLCLHMN